MPIANPLLHSIHPLLAVHRSSTIRPLCAHTSAIVIAIYTPFHILIPVVSSSTGMRRAYLYYHPTRYHHIMFRRSSRHLFLLFIFFWVANRADKIISARYFVLFYHYFVWSKALAVIGTRKAVPIAIRKSKCSLREF